MRSYLFGVCKGILTVSLYFLFLESAEAVSIVSEPTFTRASTAPLAGSLRFTTDVPARATVSVYDGSNLWKHVFLDYNTNHALPLYGFKFSRTNEISVTVYDRDRNTASNAVPVNFVTIARPAGFPGLTALVSKPEQMEPGYTIFRAVNLNQTVGYVMIVDNRGEPVWYMTTTTGSDVTQLPNGNLSYILLASVNEMNLLGQLVGSWQLPPTLRADSHDFVETDRGTFMYVTLASASLTNFPSSSTDPNAPRKTTAVQYACVIEVTKTNINPVVTKNLSLLDVIDPYHIDHLTFVTPTSQGLDHHHFNAILEDPRDNSVIVSLRNQNAVIKYSRETGKLKWILSPPENWAPEYQPYLLKPVGSPFQWQFAQHNPHYTPWGTLILFDNGNFRASAFQTPVPDDQNFSRAVEYDINEETMEVRQVWEYGQNVADPLYTFAVGSVQWLPQTSHMLINWGYVSYEGHQHPSLTATNAVMSRIKEVTYSDNPEVVFDLSVFDYDRTDVAYKGYTVYRAHRIPDLYGHPAMPVQDLSVKIQDSFSELFFSGDPFLSYHVQASVDLANWEDLGRAELDSDGNGRFQEIDSREPGATRFYRVVTK